jgi:hypothetical protein
MMTECEADSGKPVAEIVISPRSVTITGTNIDHCKRRKRVLPSSALVAADVCAVG